MANVLNRWVQKYFSDPEAVILALLLLGGFFIVVYMGKMLAPLLASLVVAYLLESVVKALERAGVARMLAILLVFTAFLALLLVILFGLVPLLSSQITQLVQVKLPEFLDRGQQMLLQLPERYPNYVSESQIKDLTREMRSALGGIGQHAWSISMASISGLFILATYLVIVPVMVFFLLKDKAVIVGWVKGILPKQRRVAERVWQEMDHQIGNYVRGKVAEILIVGVVTYIAFALLGLQYASLLSALVGLSVIVPYVGVAVVTVPVAAIGFFQWGWTSDFAYLMIIHGIIQALDGNVLVPLLFSEAVNLHPVAIIAAVVVFGGLWGFWGVFFAIPLATLVSAVISAWPQSIVEETPRSDDVASDG
jgi:putative permease